VDIASPSCGLYECNWHISLRTKRLSRKKKTRNGTGWHGMAQDGTGWHGMARDGTGREMPGVPLDQPTHGLVANAVVVWRENHQHEPLRPTMAPTSSSITRSVTVSLASSHIPLKGLARIQLNRSRSDLARVSGSQKKAITASNANPPAATNVTALAPMTPTSPPPMRGPACV
jgi:hypothetical protein